MRAADLSDRPAASAMESVRVMATPFEIVLDEPTSPAFPRATSELARPTVRGKFLYEGNQKLYVRGVTYGAFAPNSAGDQFPEPRETARDFALMQAAGINTLLTYTVPPICLLHLAPEH